MTGTTQDVEMATGNMPSKSLNTGHEAGKSTNKNIGSDLTQKTQLNDDQQHVRDLPHRNAEEERRRVEMEAAEKRRIEVEAERARSEMARKKQEEMERKSREERKRLEAEARAEEERMRKAAEAEARAEAEQKRIAAEDAERKKREAEQKKKAAEKSTENRTTQHQSSPSHAGECFALCGVKPAV